MINHLHPPWSPSPPADFGRIIGGMAWPSDLPGWAVVVGEERLPRIGTTTRHLHLLAEATEFTKTRFLDAVSELQSLYSTTGFYGRHDPHNIVHLYLHNSALSKRGLPPIDFLAAPYSEAGRVEVYADMVISLLLPTTKSLHLGEADIAKSLTLSPEDRITATSTSHPAVAALGYAVSVLHLFTPPKDEDAATQHHEDDIDPLTGY